MQSRIYSGSHSEVTGFTLVEVLLSLILASFVVMGIGQLYRDYNSSRSFVESASEMLSALTRATTLRSTLQANPNVTAVSWINNERDPEVWFFERGRSDRPPVFQLRLKPGLSLRLFDRDQLELAQFDVSIFEEGELQLLRLTNGKVRWVEASNVNKSKILAIRIMLGSGMRVWPLILWSAE